jgi:hypothetical protein
VWLPESLYAWFLDYLQKYSKGDNTAEQFRAFLYELNRLDEQGITFANPRKTQEDSQARRYAERYHKVDDVEDICLRGLDMKTKDQRTREIACTFCKSQHQSEYKACVQIKQEERSKRNQGVQTE